MLSVYDELRALAAHHLERERPDHTLQPTALVHEAWLRLRARGGDWDDRRRYVREAARAMRQLLVEHARKRAADKRAGSHCRLALPDALEAAERDGQGTAQDAGTGGEVDVLALHHAIERLADQHVRAARVVELRYFGGLTARETAEALDVSLRTVHGDWRLARAWLLRELETGEAS